jgi:hypothetical protein
MMGFRLATMVQMVGVIVLGWDFWGVPSTPIDEGNTIGRAVAVGGFLVTRVGIIFLWLRGSAEPVRIRTGLIAPPLEHGCEHGQEKACQPPQTAPIRNCT